MEHILSIIRDLAVVPSFSSYEDRIHTVVRSLLQSVGDLEWHAVADNNLVVCVPGDTSRRPVALSAHLDKINHFGDNPPAELPFQIGKEKITGQMDNAAGLAICIALAQISRAHSFPPLMLLFSEMEENFGLKHHPHLLKNGGSGLHSGMGAERISRYLRKHKMLPSAVVTIDTTPLFKGDRGVALYSGHWQFTEKKPDKLEKLRTEAIVKEFLKRDPAILHSNNTNDYLHYGAELNKNPEAGIPSIAIEPAIHPYHQKNESVYIEDIHRVYRLMIQWLEQTG